MLSYDTTVVWYCDVADIEAAAVCRAVGSLPVDCNTVHQLAAECWTNSERSGLEEFGGWETTSAADRRGWLFGIAI